MYKFKDLAVYRDLRTDQLRLAVISKKDSYREALFVADERVRPFIAEDIWKKYQINSVMERLLGLSFDYNQEFSIENLQALELGLNAALCRSFLASLVVTEDGTGVFECMKKGDLLFEPLYQSTLLGHLFTERNGKYSIAPRVPRSIISQTGVKSTIEEFPRLAIASLIKGQSPYGVFPDRSMYLDEDECPWFTLEAYNSFLAKQKKTEPDTTSSNDKN